MPTRILVRIAVTLMVSIGMVACFAHFIGRAM